MNLAEITHRAYFLDCYPLDERHLKISIQTGKDVDEVILWAGDPYSAGIAENEQNCADGTGAGTGAQKCI
jgi:cyclomaltodextrinase